MNKKIELIVGMSRQSILNKIGKIVLGYKYAHQGTLLTPSEELAILKKHMKIIDCKSVFFLADIYHLEFYE